MIDAPIPDILPSETPAVDVEAQQLELANLRQEVSKLQSILGDARAQLQLEQQIKEFRDGFAALQPSLTVAFAQFCSISHAWMSHQGFWDSNNFGEKIALIHTELSEALEAHRADAMSDHIPNMPGVVEELADTAIRLADLCGALGVNLGDAIAAKMAFNFTRPRKHGKAY